MAAAASADPAPSGRGRSAAAAALLLACASLASCAQPKPLQQVRSAAVGEARSVLIEVEPDAIVAELSGKRLGLNTCYFCDADGQRPQAVPFASALAKAKVGALRYPGGEKSDGYLWSTPPFDRPRAALARVGPSEFPSGDRSLVGEDGRTFINPLLNFDGFAGLLRATGATPLIVLAYDSQYKPAAPGGYAATGAELLQTAVAWVRYANVNERMGIRYWEIGNESYYDAYNGGATIADYSRDVVQWSATLKAIDPTIWVGASGPPGENDPGERDRKAGLATPWWPTLLATAGDSLDFLAVHSYPCYGWGSYEAYRTHEGSLIPEVEAAASAIRKHASPQAQARLRIAVTEFNSADWLGHPENKGWRHANNLGHALVLFDMMGQLLAHVRVDVATLWSSHWLNNESAPELWDAFDRNNRPLPTAQALSLWTQHMGDKLVKVKAPKGMRAFAATNSADGSLTLFIINRTKEPLRAHWRLGEDRVLARAWVWQGVGPDDPAPQLRELPVRAHEARSMPLAPDALTLLRFGAPPGGVARKRAAP